MYVNHLARIVFIGMLTLSVLGAYLASGWHEALFHSHLPTVCTADEDHDHHDEDHDHAEQCLLCDYVFYSDLPDEITPSIGAPLHYSHTPTWHTGTAPCLLQVPAPPTRGPPVA